MPLLRPIIGIVFFFGLFIFVMLAMAIGFSGVSSDKGETIRTASSGVDGTATISDEVPPVLRKLFEEVGNHKDVRTPPALIAAISNRECKPFWAFARENPDELENEFINTTKQIDGRGCGTNPSSAGALGPMQFMPRTFESLIGEIRPLSNNPSPSRVVVKDSVYGAGLLLRKNSELNEPKDKDRCKAQVAHKKTSVDDWTENDVCWAAYHYQRNCSGGYCDEVIANWKKFGGGGKAFVEAIPSSSVSGGSLVGRAIFGPLFVKPRGIGGYNQPRDPSDATNRRCHRGIDLGNAPIKIPFAVQVVKVGIETDIERATGQYDQIQKLIKTEYKGLSPGGGMVRLYIPELDFTLIFRHQRLNQITNNEYGPAELQLQPAPGTKNSLSGYSSGGPHYHVETIPGNSSIPDTLWQQALYEKATGTAAHINPYVLFNKTLDQARKERGNLAMQRKGNSDEHVQGSAYPACSPRGLR